MEEERKDENKIKVKNFLFEVFAQGEHPISKSFAKLKNCLLLKQAYEIEVFQMKISESPEGKAYRAQREWMIKQFKEERLEQEKSALRMRGTEEDEIEKMLPVIEEKINKTNLFDIPKLVELLEIETELKIEKSNVVMDSILVHKDKDGRPDPDRNLVGDDYRILKEFVNFT
jgi:hypothetical protein